MQLSLREGDFYWKSTEDFKSSILHGDECKSFDAVVVGAGVSGALCALELVERGLNVCILDEKQPTKGSTTACTAIIQYDTDKLLHELTSIIGSAKAELVYRKGIDAIEYINRLCIDVGLTNKHQFNRRPSLLLAKNPTEVATLKRELKARKAAGIDVEIIGSDQITSEYTFAAECALRSSNAAELNPVGFTELVLKLAILKGAKLISNCKVVSRENCSNRVTLKCNNNRTLVADKVVFACGYRTGDVLGLSKLGKLNSSYAGCSKVLGQNLGGWEDRAVVWEVRKPYLYFRRTEDNRIIIGGKDKPFKNTFLRDFLLFFEKIALRDDLRRIAGKANLDFDFFWVGTFGESEDSLPFIGEHPREKNVFLVMGTGGNGVTFSVFAKEILGKWIEGRRSEIGEICKVDRLSS